MPSTPLLRLSQLARFWEKNPNTILGWIRLGRLTAIRSPGGHYRVRAADVRAFCEREGMPVPPLAAPASRRVVVWTAPLARALRTHGVPVEEHDDPYDAMLAAAGAAAALRRAAATRALPIVVVATTARARTGAIERAGATRVLPRSHAGDLPAVVTEILGPG